MRYQLRNKKGVDCSPIKYYFLSIVDKGRCILYGDEKQAMCLYIKKGVLKNIDYRVRKYNCFKT